MDRLPRILFIDDQPNLLLLLTAVMTQAGFEILTAPNGAEGLKRIRADRPDLIVCDMMMPPPNGLQLRRLLSDDPDTAAIPFIFLTAQDDLEDRLAGLSSGADDYITKPFQARELIERIRAVLRRHALSRRQGQAEAERTIDQLRRFLRATAQLVGQNGALVEQIERADAQTEASDLFSRDHFEQHLNRLDDDPALFPVGILVLRAHGLKSLDPQTAGQWAAHAVHVLPEALGGEHLLFRIGGDELVALLPRCAAASLAQAADRVRTALRNPEAVAPPLTLTLGLAVGDGGVPLSTVLQQAEAQPAT